MVHVVHNSMETVKEIVRFPFHDRLHTNHNYAQRLNHTLANYYGHFIIVGELLLRYIRLSIRFKTHFLHSATLFVVSLCCVVCVQIFSLLLLSGRHLFRSLALFLIQSFTSFVHRMPHGQLTIFSDETTYFIISRIFFLCILYVSLWHNDVVRVRCVRVCLCGCLRSIKIYWKRSCEAAAAAFRAQWLHKCNETVASVMNEHCAK